MSTSDETIKREQEREDMKSLLAALTDIAIAIRELKVEVSDIGSELAVIRGILRNR